MTHQNDTKNLKSSGVVAGVVLAAGMATRMGRAKQLLEISGKILLARVLEAVLAADLDQIVLVLGAEADLVEKKLKSDQGLLREELAQIDLVFNPDFAAGQAGSIRVGLERLDPDIQAALFIMGDMAGLRPELVQKIMAAARSGQGAQVIRPLYDGIPGGPVLWPRKHFPALKSLTGDSGGRRLFRDIPPEDIFDLEFSVEERPVDLDSPEDYLAFRERFEV